MEEASYLTKFASKVYIIVRRGANGQLVRLKDVATVTQGYKEREAVIRFRGHEAVELAIYKEGDANTVSTADAIATQIENIVKTARHKTFYLSCGREDAPLIVFVHGWPELSISWRHQLPCFAGLGFRTVAPDMRGYGRSSVYPRHEDYALEHTVADMIALGDAMREAASRGKGVDDETAAVVGPSIG